MNNGGWSDSDDDEVEELSDSDDDEVQRIKKRDLKQKEENAIVKELEKKGVPVDAKAVQEVFSNHLRGKKEISQKEQVEKSRQDKLNLMTPAQQKEFIDNEILQKQKRTDELMKSRDVLTSMLVSSRRQSVLPPVDKLDNGAQQPQPTKILTNVVPVSLMLVEPTSNDKLNKITTTPPVGILEPVVVASELETVNTSLETDSDNEETKTTEPTSVAISTHGERLNPNNSLLRFVVSIFMDDLNYDDDIEKVINKMHIKAEITDEMLDYHLQTLKNINNNDFQAMYDDLLYHDQNMVNLCGVSIRKAGFGSENFEMITTLSCINLFSVLWGFTTEEKKSNIVSRYNDIFDSAFHADDWKLMLQNTVNKFDSFVLESIFIHGGLEPTEVYEDVKVHFYYTTVYIMMHFFPFFQSVNSVSIEYPFLSFCTAYKHSYSVIAFWLTRDKNRYVTYKTNRKTLIAHAMNGKPTPANDKHETLSYLIENMDNSVYLNIPESDDYLIFKPMSFTFGFALDMRYFNLLFDPIINNWIPENELYYQEQTVGALISRLPEACLLEFFYTLSPPEFQLITSDDNLRNMLSKLRVSFYNQIYLECAARYDTVWPRSDVRFKFQHMVGVVSSNYQISKTNPFPVPVTPTRQEPLRSVSRSPSPVANLSSRTPSPVPIPVKFDAIIVKNFKSFMTSDQFTDSLLNKMFPKANEYEFYEHVYYELNRIYENEYKLPVPLRNDILRELRHAYQNEDARDVIDNIINSN